MYHGPKSPDIWDVERYESRHSYVWEYANDLVALLAPQPGERIVDLGCGTGRLAARIAESGAAVIGIDSDPGMIAQARINFPQLKFQLADAATFRVAERADAVFSNAALHWVQEPARAVASIRAALKAGGRFVAEFGGKGNVRAVLDAMAAWVPSARSPWYFPGIAEYAGLLEQYDFAVTYARLFDRPTPLEGEDGMRDWLRMFGASFLDAAPAADREKALDKIENHLRAKLYRDGGWLVDYKRLRIVATLQLGE